MASLSGLEIGLSFLFVCVLLGLAAELYYLLWWKKRLSKRSQDFENQHFSSSSFTPDDLNTPNSSKLLKTHEQDLQGQGENQEQEDSEMGLKKDLILKGFEEESLDLELMRLHNLGGPPRFLFTINEETKEDLESERSRRGSRTALDTPFLSPQASSPLKTSQQLSLEYYHHHGLNPLFESNEFDFDKLRSSPPPTFKFLRDAEEKLLRRLMQAEKEGRVKKDEDFSTKTEEGEDESFVKLGVGKGKKGIQHHHHHHQISTPSQVLPLASSPSTILETK